MLHGRWRDFDVANGFLGYSRILILTELEVHTVGHKSGIGRRARQGARKLYVHMSGIRPLSARRA